MQNAYLSKKRVFLWLYCVVIIYFMFIGFDRGAHATTHHMSWTFTSIPLWFPRKLTLRNITLWVFSLGNVLAFVPFGVLIPDCFPKTLGKWWQSLIVFIIGIFFMETMQFITMRGIFDIEDIVVNVLGFLIGYISWNLAYPIDDKVHKAIVCVIFIVLITFLCICVAELLNFIFFEDPTIQKPQPIKL